VVPPNDPATLADQIQYLIGHPDEAAQLAAEARKVAVQRYSFEAIQTSLFKVFSGFE
jgi:glycosyltransferase involved in cell wall biosynthesis